MTNRVVVPSKMIEGSNINNLENLETCFNKFKGEDIITVTRNGLILSTIRKKI